MWACIKRWRLTMSDDSKVKNGEIQQVSDRRSASLCSSRRMTPTQNSLQHNIAQSAQEPYHRTFSKSDRAPEDRYIVHLFRIEMSWGGEASQIHNYLPRWKRSTPIEHKGRNNMPKWKVDDPLERSVGHHYVSWKSCCYRQTNVVSSIATFNWYLTTKSACK